MSELAQFTRLALALEPWRGQLVFVGGWAYRLFRYHSLAYTPEYSAVFTQDVDVAFRDREPLAAGGNIKDALQIAGFTETLQGDFRPPVAKYALGNEANGFYAEFLTPLTGSGVKRNGEPDATTVSAGVSAQKLRHLEVLLNDPWLVSIPASDSGLPADVHGLRIPNPICFIVQKLLIRDLRAREKRPQDVLYIHDVLQLFAASITALVPLWERLEPTMTDRQRASVRDGIEALFSEVTDILREAAAIPSDRQLAPEEMLGLCQYAFGEIFG